MGWLADGLILARKWRKQTVLSPGSVFVQIPQMKAMKTLMILAAAALLSAASAQNEYADAARELDETIAANYAYLNKLPGAQLPQSNILRREREAVHDERSLLVYAEKRIASLADHHAITGSSFRDSWAVIPTYADLWIVHDGDQFVIDAVRDGSPADKSGLGSGDVIVAVDGLQINRAVSDFWQELGLPVTHARAEYAARILVAGRRDRVRRITVRSQAGTTREVLLLSMYAMEQPTRPPVSVCNTDEYVIVRFNNSLGESATIEAFDEVMRAIPDDDVLVLDLRDTPSGGNTKVARGIMGWFVSTPQGYQIHNRPAEERVTGIPRQWIEQVLPREGRHRSRLPTILVGRWTGSMGEGLAVGFDALGAKIYGTRMAGLKGSVEDLRLGETDLFIKLPTERLLTVAGIPREDFVPLEPPSGELVSGSC